MFQAWQKSDLCSLLFYLTLDVPVGVYEIFLVCWVRWSWSYLNSGLWVLLMLNGILASVIVFILLLHLFLDVNGWVVRLHYLFGPLSVHLLGGCKAGGWYSWVKGTGSVVSLLVQKLCHILEIKVGLENEKVELRELSTNFLLYYLPWSGEEWYEHSDIRLYIFPRLWLSKSVVNMYMQLLQLNCYL